MCPGGVDDLIFMRLLKCLILCAAGVTALAVGTDVLLANGFAPQGGEQAVAGGLRGDQARPQVAVGPWGGFVVFEDNNTDRDGLGIRAQRLNESLDRVGSSFRVNVVPEGNQEKPQVALLRNGGAAFVWQGGKEGAQRIYARFLGANGTFVSGDVRVNAFTNGFQSDAAITGLGDGSVVVVYSSFGQDGSMQGVFGQRLSALGTKLGGEFQVNQVSAFNQRSAAVAALTNGNFVVTWVSELQRGGVSVDVYARVFAANGVPVGPAFAVNESPALTCANPSVSGALLGGGFAVAYSRDSNQRLSAGGGAGGVVTNAQPRSMAGWDVVARIYGASGNSLTGEFVVNETTHGDQYAPVIRSFGNQYGVVWTALGQDGSREGAFGRFIGSNGSPLEGEFRINTQTASRQIQVSLGSDNHSGMIAVWSTFVGGGNGFDLAAQKYSSEEEIPIELLSSLIPEIEEPDPTLHRLSFPSEDLITEPLPNAVAKASGNFNGLFFSKNGVIVGSSGQVSLKSTTKGAYSGRLQVAGATYSLRGTFDESGWSVSVVNRPGALPLNVYLQIDLSTGESIRGGVTDGDWWSDLQAEKQVFSGDTPSLKAGKYTLVLSGAQNGPLGKGFGTATITTAGAIAFSGVLADGTKIAQKTTHSREGHWPLYVNVNKGGGVLLGWLELENKVGSDVHGHVVWNKRADSLAKSYPAGFDNELEVTGSRYTAPMTGQKIVNITAGELTLSGGGLASPMEAALALGGNNTVTGEAGITMGFTKSSGVFKGTANTPSGSITFQGVVLQKSNEGAGFFMNAAQSGSVIFEQAE
jgi:hypothetical protein